MMVPKKQPDTSTYSGRFAVRLYELRQKAGLSAEQVAEALGVTPITVYRWESSATTPPIEIFPVLAKAYNLKRTKDILPSE